MISEAPAYETGLRDKECVEYNGDLQNINRDSTDSAYSGYLTGDAEIDRTRKEYWT